MITLSRMDTYDHTSSPQTLQDGRRPAPAEVGPTDSVSPAQMQLVKFGPDPNGAVGGVGLAVGLCLGRVFL